MRGNRWWLAAALALIVVGVIGVLADTDEDPTDRQALRVATTTTTSAPTEVLGVVVDNTTAPVASPTTTSVVGRTTTTTVAKVGRVWGYSYATSGNDQTTVTLAQGGTTVATAKTDDNGYFEFGQIAPGDYALSRTSTSSNCTTTTSSGQQPTCTMASSTAKGPEFTLSPGGEVRADVF